MNRLYRRIVLAAPTCTLWEPSLHRAGFIFRPWRRWFIPISAFAEIGDKAWTSLVQGMIHDFYRSPRR